MGIRLLLSRTCRRLANIGAWGTIVLQGGVYRGVLAPRDDGVRVLSMKGEKVAISGPARAISPSPAHSW
jgi:hypothetical protein